MRLVDSPLPRSVHGVPPTIRLDELLAAVGGHLQGPTSVTTVRGASVDSRRTTPGSCYVALRGERVDGHAFVADALRAGAVAALVDRPVAVPPDLDAAIVRVADPLHALQELAAWWRSRHAVRVVGITGSTGKTIAKEMVADVLSRTLSTLRNEGNLNSETGLPMTLLRLEPSHEAAVLEMSMYTTGEIARLAEIARPEVGVVLAVHPAHLERAGSIEAIARAKAELPEALPRDGLAVLNADDPRVAAMRDVTSAAVRTFGLGPAADVRAIEVVSHGLAGTEFTLRAPWTERRIRSGSPGRHLVHHALAAVAVAEHLAVPADEVAAALEAGSHAAHRMHVIHTGAGVTIVDDTYNASPVSVSAALAFLEETPVRNGARRLAVLGDMLELGDTEEEEHRAIGRELAGLGIARLVTLGERARDIARAARAAGVPHVEVVNVDDAEGAARLAASWTEPGDWILVKASRGMRLERVVAALREVT